MKTFSDCRLLGMLMVASLLASCASSVQKQRHWESKLMPVEIAMQIISKHFGKEWAERPKAKGEKSFASGGGLFCKAPEFQAFDYKQMEIFWRTPPQTQALQFFILQTKFTKEAIICGHPYLMLEVRRQDDLDELIDAFISVGSKIRVEN